jgi:hypothetical protein
MAGLWKVHLAVKAEGYAQVCDHIVRLPSRLRCG